SPAARYTLTLHDALPISAEGEERAGAQGDLRRLSVVDLTLKAHERRGEGAVTEGDEAGTEEVDAGAQPGRNRREDVREVAPELAAPSVRAVGEKKSRVLTGSVR